MRASARTRRLHVTEEVTRDVAGADDRWSRDELELFFAATLDRSEGLDFRAAGDAPRAAGRVVFVTTSRADDGRGHVEREGNPGNMSEASVSTMG